MSYIVEWKGWRRGEMWRGRSKEGHGEGMGVGRGVKVDLGCQGFLADWIYTHPDAGPR
jgi:hypothetical protein